MSRLYDKLKKLKSADSEAEFQAEIPLAVIEDNTARALIEVSQDFQLPGFRKGKVPEDVVKKHIDSVHLFEDAANDSLRDAINEIVTDSSLSVVGSPEVSLVKIEIGSPIVFKVRFALLPEIKLPDYKAIAKAIYERKEDSEVTEAEMQQATERIQKMMMTEPEVAAEGKLPELNDELVKKAGPFKDVAEFKSELRKQLTADKGIKQQEAKRDEMLREIVKGSKLALPSLLVDQEMERFKEQRDINIKAAGLSFEDYLKDTKKTAEELAKEERTYIEEQLRSQFVINDIQKIERIVATDQEIEMNAEFLKFRYPDRTHDFLHNMAETIIMNRKTFDMLEGKDSKNVVEEAEVQE